MELKSSRFRKEREPHWLQLEQTLQRGKNNGLEKLTTPELRSLPLLYRNALSSLSIARSITHEARLLNWLEQVSLSAYQQIYGLQANLGNRFTDFMLKKLPDAFWHCRYEMLVSFIVFMLGAITGFGLTDTDPRWFYSFVPEVLSQGRNPEATLLELQQSLVSPRSDYAELGAFSSFLFSHNAQIALLCMAAGVLWGLPTLFLLFSNGLTIGAFIAIYVAKGLTTPLLGWLSIHGTTELTAIVIAGGAGLALGRSIIYPSTQKRLVALWQQARHVALIGIVVVFMLFLAGWLEGVGRQVINETNLRFTVGGTMFLIWASWFIFLPTYHRFGKEEDA